MKLQLEGEDEPAHDFAAFTMQAVRDMLEMGMASHPELELLVRSIEEDMDWDDDEDDRLK